MAPSLYIFDADGTLRYTTVPGQRCPWRDGEWRLMPNVRQVLRTIDWGPHGCAMGIASNQTAVSEGHLTAATSLRLLQHTVAAAVAPLPARLAIEACMCPADPPCACRKPAPGMLVRLLRRFGLDPEAAVFVGDLGQDQAAAAAARVPFRWARDFFGWR